MHIAPLARAENELLASALEDELRFVFREHVRGAVVLLRQLLLPLHHFAGEANDHVVLIGLSINRDGAECGPFDLHGLIVVPGLRTRLILNEASRGDNAGEPNRCRFRNSQIQPTTPAADCGAICLAALALNSPSRTTRADRQLWHSCSGRAWANSPAHSPESTHVRGHAFQRG
jgi:hypothetical protein